LGPSSGFLGEKKREFGREKKGKRRREAFDCHLGQ